MLYSIKVFAEVVTKTAMLVGKTTIMEVIFYQRKQVNLDRNFNNNHMTISTIIINLDAIFQSQNNLQNSCSFHVFHFYGSILFYQAHFNFYSQSINCYFLHYSLQYSPVQMPDTSSHQFQHHLRRVSTRFQQNY